MAGLEEFTATVASLCEAGEYDQVIEKYEEAQKAGGFNGESAPQDWYVRHMFCCFITDRLAEAKFLWKRISDEYKTKAGKNSELNATWKVGQALWSKNYVEVHRSLNGFAWRISADLVDHFKSSYQKKMINLIAKAYQKIRSEKAADLLGVIPSNLEGIVNEMGWSISNGFVIPKKAQEEDTRQLSVDSIRNITTMVSFLEKRHHVFN